MIDRVLPRPDRTSEPFWDAARSGVLAIPWCASCARYQFPPRRVCADCDSTALEFRAVSGRARLVSWTTTHADVAYADHRPYVSIVVELAEQSGLFLLADFIGESVDEGELVPGRAMTVVFGPTAGDDTVLPQFEWADTEVAP